MSNTIIQLQKRMPAACMPLALLEWASKDFSSVPAAAAKEPGKNFYGDSYPSMTVRDGIAFIEIQGVLMQNPGRIEKGLGAQGYNEIQDMLDEALATSGLKGICLLVDSPGGGLTGAPETAQAIREASKRVPVAAYSESVMGSAAYMLSCAASVIATTGSAIVGSIGVISQVADLTRLYEAAGISIHTFTSGSLKGVGNPYIRMNEAFSKHLQGSVDNAGARFRSFVKQQRPSVQDSSLEGQTFDGQDAVAAGLADKVVTGRSQLLATLQDRKWFQDKDPSMPARASSQANDYVAEWQNSAALQAEFPDAKCYAAFAKAEKSGKVAIRSCEGAVTSRHEAEGVSPEALAAYEKHQGSVRITTREKLVFTRADFPKQ